MSDGVYDFIIVGAGTAGCILAHHLSEDPGCRVLVLEAGGSDQRSEIHTPLAFPKLLRSPVDWAHYTVPQPALNGRRVAFPAGKVVGGTGSLSAGVYAAGDPKDYDDWPEGWRFDDLRPFFDAGPPPQHLREVNPLTHAFVDSATALGSDNVGYSRVLQKCGRRWSTADTHLHPVRHRPNLTILSEACVTRLRFDGDRADGVDLIHGGQVRFFGCRREILLTAGVIASPRLLLLSGIGDPDQLTRLGIRPVHALPGVGENLCDHPRISVAARCDEPVSLLNGPRSSPLIEARAAFEDDLELQFLPLELTELGLDPTGRHGFTIHVRLTAPRSRGRVRLRHASPNEPPAIDPAYLTASEDLDRLRAGLNLARRVLHEGSLASFEEVVETLPGAKVESEEDANAFIQHSLDSAYNAGGTCRMGTDELAVVDAELRVRGIRGLRMVDASVIPILPRGLAQAPVMAIAEKAARLIQEFRER